MWKVLKDAAIDNIPFYVLMGISIILVTISFFLPPKGAIDSSVLMATGEFFGWAGLWALYKAIDKGTKAKVEHKGTTITVNDKEDQE